MMFKKLLLALLAARSIEAGRDSRRAHFDWDKTDFVYVLIATFDAIVIADWLVDSRLAIRIPMCRVQKGIRAIRLLATT